MTTPRDARDGAQVPQEDAMDAVTERVADMVQAYVDTVLRDGPTAFASEIVDLVAAALATPRDAAVDPVWAYDVACDAYAKANRLYLCGDGKQECADKAYAAEEAMHAARKALVAALATPPAPVRDVPFDAPGSLFHGWVKPRRFFNVGDRVRLTEVQGTRMTDVYTCRIGEHGTVTEVSEDPFIGVRYIVAFDTFSWEDDGTPYWLDADQLHRLPDRAYQPPAPVSRAGAVEVTEATVTESLSAFLAAIEFLPDYVKTPHYRDAMRTALEIAVLSMSTVGERIRDARKEKRLSQTELGKLMRRPRTHAAVSELEKGKVRAKLDDLEDLARLLDKPLSYFTQSALAAAEGRA